MKIVLCEDNQSLGQHSASHGAELIRRAIADRGRANIMFATGTSQFQTLSCLAAEEVDWTCVTGFHLDEYIGLSATHNASFRRYLRERFVSRVPIRNFHFIEGDAANLDAEVERLGDLIRAHPIDVTFLGVGENGHLAFNDPPADFQTPAPYIVVGLDEACRNQQLGEGWFPSLKDVPCRAISSSISQIMKSTSIICSVPDARKAVAIQRTIEGPVMPSTPASILQRHSDATIYLDPASASLLRRRRPSAMPAPISGHQDGVTGDRRGQRVLLPPDAAQGVRA